MGGCPSLVQLVTWEELHSTLSGVPCHPGPSGSPRSRLMTTQTVKLAGGEHELCFLETAHSPSLGSAADPV